jgi:hypothetical protein
MTEDELDRLEQDFRTLADKVDPVPGWVKDGARMAFGLRTLDAELLRLERDTAVDADTVGVRGTPSVRELSFATGDMTLDAEVVHTGPYVRRLVGQLVPPVAAAIEVLTVCEGRPGPTLAAQADELGRFLVDDIPAGPMRVLIGPLGGGPRVMTQWTVL